MAVLIPLMVAGTLVALSLADRANRRSSDERAVAASRADLERLGDIVASVHRDVLDRPQATRDGEPAPAQDAEHPPRPAARHPRPRPDHVAARPWDRRRTVAAIGALTALVAVTLAGPPDGPHPRPLDIADGPHPVGSAVADGHHDAPKTRQPRRPAPLRSWRR
jgi:hypothetical protein